MKAYVLFFILPVVGVLLSCSSCSSDAANLSGWGEFCNNSGDCLAGLVCKGNVCIKPDEPSLDGDVELEEREPDCDDLEMDVDDLERVDEDISETEQDVELEEVEDVESGDNENDSGLMPGEKRLSFDVQADGLDPADINGDYVVWCHGGSGRLFVHCISEDWTDELTVEGVDHLCYWTSVANGKVYSAGVISYDLKSEVFEIDIASREHRILNFRDSQSYIFQVNARGKYVAWQESVSGLQIGLYNVEDDSYLLLTQESLTHKKPKLSEQYVVWDQTQSSGNGSDIWLYDLDTEAKQKISENASDDSFYRIDPVVWGHYAAWNSVNGEDEIERYIWLIDLDNSQHKKLVTTGLVGGPWIEDDHIYWNEQTSKGFRIRMMDIKSGEYFWITDERWEGSQGYPKVSGRWLMYLDHSRLTAPQGALLGVDVILFDLCTLDHFKNEDMCR